MKLTGLFYLFVFFCTLAFIEARADRDLQKHYSRLIGRTKTKAELQKIDRLIRDFEIAQESCEIQLESKQIPFSCFEQIKFQEELGILNRTKAKKAVSLLNEICLNRKSLEVNSSLIEEGLKKIPQKTECYSEVLRKRELLIYKEKESDPARLLNQLISN